jgi:zinc protease
MSGHHKKKLTLFQYILIRDFNIKGGFRMKKKIISIITTLLFIGIIKILPQDISKIDISYKKFVLNNGLTLIVHEDHKAPIVAVNVWYHVGSKNEVKGKTGFAHLFEHLMFNGSENFNDDYFQAMERVGATDMNGTTNEDRTNYFEDVPTSAVDVALWMESDRMGHLLGAIDQAKLDEQRGVVQNEKRQGENQPYGRKVSWAISENTYPENHPYHWQTIGYMEDLDSASLSDVKSWFEKFYGAANAILSIAGDVNTDSIKLKVEKYFGDIPPGPPIEHQKVWVAKMSGTKRMTMQDRVPQGRVYEVWNIPEYGAQDLAYLDLLSDVLAMGKKSRLYNRLVYDEQIATDVHAYYSSGEIGSQFNILATAKKGVPLSRIESEIDEELNKLLKDGPTNEELEKVKTTHISNFVRGIERIGGFGGTSDILAQGEVYTGSPDFYKTRLKWVSGSTPGNIKEAGNKWLSDGKFILEVLPYPEYSTSKSTIDRSKLPVTGTPPEAVFPDFHKTTLSNGLKVILAKRTSIPLVEFNLVVNAGFAADQFGVPGLASLTSDMMEEGTKSMDALQISDELLKLGAHLSSGSSVDNSTVYLSALKSNLEKSLQLFADVILNPSFPESNLERLKKERIASIEQEKASPFYAGLRVLPILLFGKNNAYGTTWRGNGDKESIEKITREDLINFHKTWFKPNNATLIIAGDASLDELKPELERIFGGWQKGEVPEKKISSNKNVDKPMVYLINIPDAQQSVIFAADIVPPKSEMDDIAAQTANNIFGGMFTSRINMNLRENKHWTYGAHSTIRALKGERPFLTYAPVQTDKTKEAVQEMIKELTQFVGNKPPTQEELQKAKQNQTLELPGRWETINDIVNYLTNIVLFNLPDDYYKTYSEKVKNLSLKDITKAAEKIIKPENMIWVVVGDQSKIEQGIKDLGYEVKVIDSEVKGI